MKTLLAIMLGTLGVLYSTDLSHSSVAEARSLDQRAWATRAKTLLPHAPGSRRGANQAASTFATVHITIDPLGKPLGAYQFELTSADVPFKVLGVEAGDHTAFDHGRPPYFDPVVQQDGTDRLILAEYALPHLDAEELPTQPIRIASVSVLFDQAIDADNPPAIELTLITAGDADGKKIEAKLSHTLQIPERPE